MVSPHVLNLFKLLSAVISYYLGPITMNVNGASTIEPEDMCLVWTEKEFALKPVNEVIDPLPKAVVTTVGTEENGVSNVTVYVPVAVLWEVTPSLHIAAPSLKI